MSLSAQQTGASRIRTMTRAGIAGSVLMIVFGLIALVSPPQIGNQIVRPGLYRIKNLLEVAAFAGWALICLAYYETGAAARGWLAKIALVLATLGAITASVSNVVNAIALQDVGLPDWANLILFGLVFAAPVLLGIGAIRVRMLPPWDALYPIVIVGIVPMAVWIVVGDGSPSFPAIVQSLAWIGFALLAMAIRPGG